MGVVQICSHSGATYGICDMVAETVSVKCTEHSYQHSASDLALILYVCNLGGSSARSYCGATYNTSPCAMTKAVFSILIFFSKTTSRWHPYYAIIFLNVGLS